MTIDRIEKTGRYRYAIWADEALLLSVTSAQLALLDISEGETLEGERLDRFERDIRHMAAQAAMDLLIRRDHAEEELKKKLIRKGFCEPLAEYGLDYVRRFHYTDDDRYAAGLVRKLQGTCSSRMMKMKLLDKGLSAEAIDRAVSENGWDDQEGIRREIRRKYGENTAILQDDQALSGKLIQALLRKGYHYGDIREVLRESLTRE